MKVYLVFMEDEWHNNTYLGVYEHLENALPDINEWLSTYDTQIDTIQEYASTFSMCFDMSIETPDETYVYVRGFILDDSQLKPTP